MKTLLDLSIKLTSFSIIFILLFPVWTFAQQGVAISTDGSSPDPSAMLHVIANDKGVLIPNLILDDVNTAAPVSSPAIGLLIYNDGGTEPDGFYYWDGAKWQPLLAGKLAILSDNDADTRIEMDDGTDPDEIAFIIDTNEVMRLDSKTLHLEAPGESFFIGKGAGANDDGTDNLNTFLGLLSGTNNTEGHFNVGLGPYSLTSNTEGRYNMGLGPYALTSNTSGSANIGIGESAMYYNETGNANTAIGGQSLFKNISGSFNSAVGHIALHNNQGKWNTALGMSALYNLRDQDGIIGIGAYAGYSDTSGTSNTYIGHRAGYNALSGSENTYLGDSTGYHNATGSRNTYIGKQAGYGSETGGDGDGNVALGTRSLFSIEYGKNNIAIGDSALFHNTIGDRNTAIGSSALEYNTIGSLNTAIGYDALVFNSTGYHNTAIGPNALLKNTSGFINIAIGNDALRLNTTGFHNTAIGSYALLNNTSGHFNIAIGTNTIAENITGSYNTALGEGALRFNNTGFHNTAIGYNALFSNTTGCGNVGIGDSVSYNLNDQSGIVAVGSNAGFNNALGERNTFIGYQSGYNTGQTVNNLPGNDNVFLGYLSGYTNDYGLKNTYLGKEAGYGATGNNNIFVGHQAGMNETGNGKLYIEPTSSANPLLYGDFDNDYLTVHGKLGVGTKDPGAQVHIHKDDFNQNYLRFTNNTTGLTGNTGVLVGLDPAENFRIHSYENTNIQYYMNNSLRMDMESSGGDVSMKLLATAGNNAHLKLFKGTGYGYEFEMYGTSSVDKLYLWSRKFGGIDSIRMTWQKDGKVGIGTTTPQEMLHVNGNAQFVIPDLAANYDLMVTGDGKLSASLSDARLKKNVNTLEHALDKIVELRGVSYTWKDQEKDDIRHGLIAQEVKEVIPELVFKRDKYYGLNYSELSGFFVEAIKEQQELIQTLQTENKALKTALDKIEERMVKLERTYENNN